MSGETEVPLAVYVHLNQSCQNPISAWTDHVELLSILDRRPEAAAVLAALESGSVSAMPGALQGGQCRTQGQRHFGGNRTF
jgi:hypothetical protein